MDKEILLFEAVGFFQFPLWDIGKIARLFVKRLSDFQFPLWDIDIFSIIIGVMIGILSIPFMGYQEYLKKVL